MSEDEEFCRGMAFYENCVREGFGPVPHGKEKKARRASAREFAAQVEQGPALLWDTPEDAREALLPVAHDIFQPRAVNPADPESPLSDGQKHYLTRRKVVMIPGSHDMRQKHYRIIVALLRQYGHAYPVVNGQKMHIAYLYGKAGLFPLAAPKTKPKPA